jgi:beta-N-acetylhexosaminidase
MSGGSGAPGGSVAPGASGASGGSGLVLRHPLIIEVEPQENIAAGGFTWGLSPWVPEGSVRRISVRAADGQADHGSNGGAPTAAGTEGAGDAAGILDAAVGRSLVVVVRDAHRDQSTRSLVTALLSARPDLVLVEMGLPRWSPPDGTRYLVTYGASRANAQAAAEMLGLV